MSPKQLERRTAFVQKLSSGGWDPGSWERLFATGVDLTPEAQAEYQNSFFRLRLSYYAPDEFVLLELMNLQTGSIELPKVRFYPVHSFESILDTITAKQNSISEESYPDLMKNMIPLCKLVLLETADGLLKLSA